MLEQSEGCPKCGGPVSNQTLKVVPVEPQEAIVKARARRHCVLSCTLDRGALQRALTRAAPQSALYGLNPENIIKAAHAGFSWWIDQTGANADSPNVARRDARTAHLLTRAPLAPDAELTYQEFMGRAAETANTREQRIKAKLQEARAASAARRLIC